MSERKERRERGEGGSKEMNLILKKRARFDHIINMFHR